RCHAATTTPIPPAPMAHSTSYLPATTSPGSTGAGLAEPGPEASVCANAVPTAPVVPVTPRALRRASSDTRARHSVHDARCSSAARRTGPVTAPATNARTASSARQPRTSFDTSTCVLYSMAMAEHGWSNAVAAARSAWPGVHVPDGVFEAYV